MQNQTRNPLPLIIIGGLVLFLLYGGGASVVPTPRPDGPDLVPAFRTNNDRTQARQHAHIFATICGKLAECLEYDGSRTDPLIKTGVQIDELRRSFRQVRTGGWSFLHQYPELGTSVDQFLTTEIGTSGGPLTPEQRRKWIDSMRRLEASANYAADQG
jgi:hypothetical protein